MRSGPRVWGLAAAIAFALVAVVGTHPAHAARSEVAKAREHARKGDALVKLEKYREALAEFEAAYVGDSEPTALFNIARCHQLMGEGDAAVRFYRRYLDEAPRGRLRPYAQKHIAALEHPVLVPLVETVAASPPVKPAPPAASPAPAPVKPAPPVTTAPVKPLPTAAPAPVKPAAPATVKPPPPVAPAPAKPTVAAWPAAVKPAPPASAPPAAPSTDGYAPVAEPRFVKASEVKPAPAPAHAAAPAPARVALAANPPAASPPSQAVLVTSPAPTDKSDAKGQRSHRTLWSLLALLAVGVAAGAAAFVITQRSSSAAPEPPCPAPRMCQ